MSTTAEPETLVAGVELGGTKAIAVVGHGRTILDRISLPTTTPQETLGALGEQLGQWRDRYGPKALGIASFGPVSVHREAADYGHMLATPKPGWAGADILGALSAALPGPCAIHTDVTAAALAEGRWGAAQGLGDFVYVTIGTGIGMGVIAGGRPVSGQMHPEAGHIRVRRMAGDDFAGVCPFHGDCLEGLAAGPAIAARAGRPAQELAPDDAAWSFTADALAEGFVDLLFTLASQRILIGGGVGVGQPQLLPMIRTLLVEKAGGYLPFVSDTSVDELIAPAALGGEAGPLGAIRLAELAL